MTNTNNQTTYELVIQYADVTAYNYKTDDWSGEEFAKDCHITERIDTDEITPVMRTLTQCAKPTNTQEESLALREIIARTIKNAGLVPYEDSVNDVMRDLYFDGTHGQISVVESAEAMALSTQEVEHLINQKEEPLYLVTYVFQVKRVTAIDLAHAMGEC